jgi:hypothetical protein
MSVWNLFNTLSSALFGIMDETPDRYTPSFQDVIDVKQILAKKGTLPLELVDTIIDFAEYWIMTTTCRTSGQVTIHARGEFENKLLVSWLLHDRYYFHANRLIAKIIPPWLRSHER